MRAATARLLAPPLAALVILGGSGFLHELERTSRASIAYARSSRTAPSETEAALQGVADLPASARFTRRQAEAFESLADALEVSLTRVETLGGSLDDQIATLEELRSGLGELSSPLGCIHDRLDRLVRVSTRGPTVLGDIGGEVDEISAAQVESLRHLRSINRKLAALGLVATASGVEAPPPPGGAPAPAPGLAPAPLDC